MKFTSDIDIDFADRDSALRLITHTPAVIMGPGQARRHNTGVYVTDIPSDPRTGCASIDHRAAQTRGYLKLDFLNVWVYRHVRDPQHLTQLMAEPDWTQLRDPQFFAKLIHLGRHYETQLAMPEPIDSRARMAMFLSVIRPGKRHLIGQTWAEVSKTVWLRSEEGYWFKKSHAVAYANLVVVHMNLLAQGLADTLDQGD